VISRSGSRKGSGFSSTDRTTVNSATFAPIPNAMIATAVTANAGARSSVLIPIRASRSIDSALLQLHVSRAWSLSAVGFPNARSAA